MPPAGFTGTDIFTYQRHQHPWTQTRPVAAPVGQRVWYIRDVVDANNTVGGNGRSSNAFDNDRGVQRGDHQRLHDDIFIIRTATVTYTPAANSNGLDSFTFTANDGTIDSNTATVEIDVTPVNDVPGFTKGADQTVLEDAGAQTVTPWATGIGKGAANESAQTLTFLVTANDNAGLFSAGPAIAPDGTLTYTPAATRMARPTSRSN